NLMFATLLIATVAISITASFLFTKRLNDPINRILDIVQNRSSLPLRSQVRKFDMISEKIGGILRTNDKMTEDLDKKRALLRYFAYTNKLRNIHMNIGELQELVDEDTPFMLVLFQITFKERFSELETEREKAIYFIREYIDSSLLNVYPD